MLGIYSGEADVLLGDDEGKIVTISADDIIIILAGVGHKNMDSEDLGDVGAYPNGMTVDLIRADKKERPRVDKNIAKVPKPNKDPLQGAGKGLINIW